MHIVEYDYYEATLSISVITQRPEAAPSNVLTAATLHEQFAAQVRTLLREYKKALNPYLPFYDIIKIQPAGTTREVDREFNQDLIRLHFSLGIALTAAAWTGNELAVFAFERNIEKATKDLFAANQIPDVFIPDDTGTVGESLVDIVCQLGVGSNLGDWNIPPS